MIKGLPCFYIQSQKGGTRHAEMPVQIPMGQAAQESFAGRQGNHGLLGKAGLTGGISQGRAKYCGYTNDVMPGMWSGGVVGLKSILGVKRRTEALEIMNTLSRFGYIRYTLDEKTKKLEYVVTDWVVKCSGAECMSGAVYATDGYGFLCLPRNITQRLADQHYTFGESDAWLDLWCHTVWQETGNAFSYLAPAVQFRETWRRF